MDAVLMTEEPAAPPAEANPADPGLAIRTDVYGWAIDALARRPTSTHITLTVGMCSVTCFPGDRFEVAIEQKEPNSLFRPTSAMLHSAVGLLMAVTALVEQQEQVDDANGDDF